MLRRAFFPAVIGAFLAGASLAQPAISFEEKAVVARGLPPGGQAVLFGIAREPQGFFTRVVRRQDLLPADASGQARLDLGRTVPPNSIWFAVDLGSGSFRSASPQGSGAKEIAIPGDAVRVGSSGRAGRLFSTIGFVEILYVRPSRGAWSLTVGHGGESDDPDSPDHSIAAALDRMRPLGSSPPPPNDFAPGDVVLVVDPRQLVFFAAQVR